MAETVAHARRILAIAVAFVRAKCLRQILTEEAEQARKAGAAMQPTDSDWREFRVCHSTRLTSLLAAFYTAVPAVTDGWTRSGLSDSRICWNQIMHGAWPISATPFCILGACLTRESKT